MTVPDGLAGVIDPALISTDERDLVEHAGDWSTRSFLARRASKPRARPRCVVRPRSTDDVKAILGWAHDARVGIVPFGGGSGVCDAVAADDAVVIDLSDMGSVIAVDERSRLVTAQAGITGPGLEGELRPRGLTLGHEPQSMSISTVGGWIATRACGQLSARYGGIESMLVGLEAVLPGGKVVRSRASPRRATGPDVASLMIGSEGTLGVVTEATLKVVPRPDLPRMFTDRCVRFEHMTDAVAGCRALAQSDLQPTLVRLYDPDDGAIFFRDHPDPPTGAVLMLSFAGFDVKARAERALEVTGGDAIDPGYVAYWWEHRNDAVRVYEGLMEGGGLLGPHALIDTMEVSGTWTVLRDIYHSMKDVLSAETDLCGCHLSHVYPDGACLYFTMASACSSDEDALERHRRWWEVGMAACLEARGAISHHHGIGRLKAPWLPAQLGGWWEVLQTVKQAVDPHGIMNPGALGL